MLQPLVSINCITYNHTKYIRKCLDGFVTQKTKFLFEVLIHDDASTDGTQDIIREYENKYPEIIKPIYQTENQFSKGIDIFSINYSRANGKYMALCEGDDYWTDENKLQIQADFLETHPDFSVCFHALKVVYENNNPDSIFPLPRHRFYKDILSLNDLLKHNFIQTNSVMYRCTINKNEINKYIPENILPLDWYWHLIHAKFGRIGFIDKCMGVYYKHNYGLWCGNYALNHSKKIINFYENVIEQIAENKKEYLYSVLIPSLKRLYNNYKKHNNLEGISLINKNKYWTKKNIKISDSYSRKRKINNKLNRLINIFSYKQITLYFRKITKKINSFGNKKQCYICKKSFFYFNKYNDNSGRVSAWINKYNIVGSDLNNYSCQYCHSIDRERHFFAYFNKLNLWPKENSKILHFAPEYHLIKKIQECNPLEYIKADYIPEPWMYKGIMDIKKINLMEIPYTNNYFDIVICNHVLEHIPDIHKGISEIYRVLKNDGFAILQTPYSKSLHKHLEDSGQNSEESRIQLFGQCDHVRTISEKQFFIDLENTGFKLDIARHDDLFDNNFAAQYGVNPKEDLIKAVKI